MRKRASAGLLVALGLLLTSACITDPRPGFEDRSRSLLEFGVPIDNLGDDNDLGIEGGGGVDLGAHSLGTYARYLPGGGGSYASSSTLGLLAEDRIRPWPGRTSPLQPFARVGVGIVRESTDFGGDTGGGPTGGGLVGGEGGSESATSPLLLLGVGASYSRPGSRLSPFAGIAYEIYTHEDFNNHTVLRFGLQYAFGSVGGSDNEPDPGR